MLMKMVAPLSSSLASACFNELGRVQNLGKTSHHPPETSVLTLGKMHKHLTFFSQIRITETTMV